MDERPADNVPRSDVVAAKVVYPCGCAASPYICKPTPLPDYCPTHGAAPKEAL